MDRGRLRAGERSRSRGPLRDHSRGNLGVRDRSRSRDGPRVGSGCDSRDRRAGDGRRHGDTKDDARGRVGDHDSGGQDARRDSDRRLPQQGERREEKGRGRGVDERERRGEGGKGPDRRTKRENEGRDSVAPVRGGQPPRRVNFGELQSRLEAFMSGKNQGKQYPKYSKELKELERRLESKVKAALQRSKEGEVAEPWPEVLPGAVEVLEGGGRIPQETLNMMLEAIPVLGSSNEVLAFVLFLCLVGGTRLDVRSFAKILGVFMYRGAPAAQIRVLLNLVLPKGQSPILSRPPTETAEALSAAISGGSIASLNNGGASAGNDQEPQVHEKAGDGATAAGKEFEWLALERLHGSVWSYDPRAIAYFSHFCTLLHLEHLNEVDVVQTQRNKHPVEMLVQMGLAISGLSVIATFGRREPGSGRTVLPGWEDTGNEMVAFSLRGSQCNVGRLRMFRGDAVTVSRGDPLRHIVGEADVVEVKTGDKIIVQLKGSMPKDAKEDRGAWRLDKGVNTAAYERQMAALLQISGSNQPGKRPPLAELLISARVGDIDQWAEQMQQGKQARANRGETSNSQPTCQTPKQAYGYYSKEARAARGEINPNAEEGWKVGIKSTTEIAEEPPQARTIWDRVGARDGKAPDEGDIQEARRMLDDVKELNASQRAAISAALNRTCTLIQGPPGTGKTHVSVQILRIWAHGLKLTPLLASSDSNVAVDNIAEGLKKAGVDVVRTGRGEKVRHSVETITLDAIFARQKAEKMKEEGRECSDEGDLEDSAHASSIEFALMQDETSGRSRKGANKGSGKICEQEGHEQEWKKRAQDFEMQMKILQSAEVICTTTISAGGDFLQKFHFAGALIDEVAQATELSAIVPVVLRGAKRVVFVGDDCQLPPGVRSQEAQLRGLSMSVYSRLRSAGGVKPFFLDTQYRSHPLLAEFSAKEIYQGALHSGISAESRPMPKGFNWPNPEVPVAFLNSDPFEEQKEGESRANQNEADWLAQIVHAALHGQGSGCLSADGIGVVTPYSAQVQLLRRLLTHEGPALEIASIDAFQGREKELILFSAVRANAAGRVGFLADWRRLNVMLTRARRGLIVVGSVSTLRNDEHWRRWLEWVLKRRAAEASTLTTLEAKLASPLVVASSSTSLASKALGTPTTSAPRAKSSQVTSSSSCNLTAEAAAPALLPPTPQELEAKLGKPAAALVETLLAAAGITRGASAPGASSVPAPAASAKPARASMPPRANPAAAPREVHGGQLAKDTAAAARQEVAPPMLVKHILAALTKRAKEIKDIPGATELAARICPDMVSGRPVSLARVMELVQHLNKPPGWWMANS